MNKVNCINCNKEFKYTCQLTRHYNAKRKCKQNLDKDNDIFTDDLKTLKSKFQKITNQIVINDISYENGTCLYCLKTYSSKSNAITHIRKSCKIRRKLEEQLKNLEKLIKNYNVKIIFTKPTRKLEIMRVLGPNLAPNTTPNLAPNTTPNTTPNIKSKSKNKLKLPLNLDQNPIPNPIPNPILNPILNPIQNPIQNIPNPIPNPVQNPIPNSNPLYKRKSIPKKIRELVWDSYIGIQIGESKCKCCESTNISQLTFHCGHIVSDYNGGDISISNLLPICMSCNLSMGRTNLYEFKRTFGL